MKRFIMTTTLALLGAAAMPVAGQGLDNLSAAGAFFNDTVARSVIVARRTPPADLSQPGVARLSGAALGRAGAALGTADLMMHIRRLPGVAAGGGFQPGFFVRGGTGDDNQVLLDGIPVFQTGHLGGLFSAFNTDALASVALYAGGMPARYGGRASSVLDIETADGNYDRFHGAFSAGLTDGRLHLSGPVVKDRVSVSLSMRRSWLDLLVLPLVNEYGGDSDSPEDLNLAYCFWDMDARASCRIGSGAISALFHYGKDPLQFNYAAVGEGMETLNANVDWTSMHYGLSLATALPCGLQLDALAYASICSGLVDISSEDQDLGLKSLNGIADYGIKAALSGERGDDRFRIGVDASFKRFSSGMDLNDDRSPTRRYTCDYSLYVDDEHRLDRDVVICPGLRAVACGIGPDIMGSLEPRFSLKWQMSRASSLKISYSNAVQYLHKVATGMIDFPSYVWMPASSSVSPMRVKQLSSAVSWYAAENVKLSAEAFYKYMTGVYDYFGEQTLVADMDSWNRICLEGRGRGYGVEGLAVCSGGGLKVSASYTLSWSERSFTAIGPGWFADRYDNRHKIVIDMEYSFNDHLVSTLSWICRSGGRWNYHDSNSTGLISVSLPAYDRMDIGFDYVKEHTERREKRWRLSVYNLYNARNPLICTVVPFNDDEAGYALDMAGNIPFLPTVSYLLKF